MFHLVRCNNKGSPRQIHPWWWWYGGGKIPQVTDTFFICCTPPRPPRTFLKVNSQDEFLTPLHLSVQFRTQDTTKGIQSDQELLSDYPMELLTLTQLALLFASASAASSKTHLYKQIPPSRTQSHPLCTDGRKLAHPDPDSSHKYFICQYISKADMWLIHPHTCSDKEDFNDQTQRCESKAAKAATVVKSQSDAANSNAICVTQSESILKLSAALENLSDALRRALRAEKPGGFPRGDGQHVKLMTTIAPATKSTSTPAPAKVSDVVNLNDIQNREDHGPGNGTNSKEDIADAEIVPLEKTTAPDEQKPEWNSITADDTAATAVRIPQIPTPPPNPFLKLFFQNLIKPNRGPPATLEYFHSHSPPISKPPIPVVQRPSTSDSDNHGGKFVNLFSFLNLLTGGPEENSEESGDFPQDNEKPLTQVKIQEIQNDEDSSEQLRRKPVHSTRTGDSSANYDRVAIGGKDKDWVNSHETHAQSQPVLFTQSRKPRLP